MSKINLNRLIADTATRLKEAGIDDGAAEAELILCELLDFDRLHLYLNGPSLLDDHILQKFNDIIERRLTRYPLQYILGSAWFFGRKFMINEAVMVPTPETEFLLDLVLGASRNNKSPHPKLLDIGCGAGIIAISAKLENPNLEVTALDISDAALQVARQNAAHFEIDNQLRFVESDLFTSLGKNEKFDIIASNPPYIADGDYDGLPPEVKADPKTALLGGVRGLDIISRIITESPRYLHPAGFLMFEMGYNQAEEVLEMVKKDGRYVSCNLIKDLNDIDRVAVCRIE